MCIKLRICDKTFKGKVISEISLKKKKAENSSRSDAHPRKDVTSNNALD